MGEKGNERERKRRREKDGKRKTDTSYVVVYIPLNIVFMKVLVVSVPFSDIKSF